MSSDGETVMAVYDEWEAANEKVAALSLDAVTHTDLLELQRRREVVARSLPATDHQIINRMVAEADPKALGGTSWADVLSTKLGISKGEARKRIKQAGLLGPRWALTGEPLPPKLPNVAAPQARGQDRGRTRQDHREFLRRSAWLYRRADARSGGGGPGTDCDGVGARTVPSGCRPVGVPAQPGRRYARRCRSGAAPLSHD